MTAQYRCPRWYPFVAVPLGLALCAFGIVAGVATVVAPDPATTASSEPAPAGAWVMGIGIALVFLAIGGRMLFGRAMGLETDGTNLHWRAPFRSGDRSVADLRVVKCTRWRFRGIAGNLGHGRNHRLVFHKRFSSVPVYTGPGFRPFVDVLVELNPHVDLALSPGLPGGWSGFSAERGPGSPVTDRGAQGAQGGIGRWRNGPGPGTGVLS